MPEKEPLSVIGFQCMSCKNPLKAFLSPELNPQTGNLVVEVEPCDDFVDQVSQEIRSKLMRKLREKILEAQAVALDGQVLNLTPMTQIIDMFITFADLYDPTGKEIPSDVS